MVRDLNYRTLGIITFFPLAKFTMNGTMIKFAALYTVYLG